MANKAGRIALLSNNTDPLGQKGQDVGQKYQDPWHLFHFVSLLFGANIGCVKGTGTI